MLKKIKNFLKWIADHTGISWIARKIASGWNSIKNLWSSNKANLVSDPKKRIVELSFVELSNGKVELVMSQDIDLKLPNNKNEHGNVLDNEFRLDSHDNRKVYITGRYDSKTIIEGGNICLSINSVGTLDGKEVYGDNELKKMKELLDLSDKRHIEINSNAPKVIANGDVVNSDIANALVTPVAGTVQSIGQ